MEKKIFVVIDEKIVNRKNKANLTWKGIILAGLEQIEGRISENDRLIDYEKRMTSLERQIGKLTELLRNSDYATKILNEAKKNE